MKPQIKGVHPWHDVSVGSGLPKKVNMIVEIPKDGKIKYELDKETGMLRMDRFMYSAVLYPGDYGFIPRTLWEDGDPLDIFVLTHTPAFPLTICEVNVIGVIRMFDGDEKDDKIISVHSHDPRFGEWKSISDVPQHYLRELRHFLETYKELQGKKTKVFEILGPEDAFKDIEKAIKMYKDTFE
jgi:inorganic pyrophosphatase